MDLRMGGMSGVSVGGQLGRDTGNGNWRRGVLWG